MCIIIKRSFRCGAFKACCNTCQQVQVGNEFIYIYLCLFIFIYKFLLIASCNFIVLQPKPPYTPPTFFMYKSFWPFCSSHNICRKELFLDKDPSPSRWSFEPVPIHLVLIQAKPRPDSLKTLCKCL